jgi:dTDP-4-amino-4,6-dideoxygalactose transaminase
MHLDHFALFGASPAFDRKVHVGQPNLGDRERFLERVNDIWDRRWLSNHGPYVQEFERRIAEQVGVKHCIATCNGTIALEIAIRALDLQGEVIVPSFTFIATAHALQWQAITPVFCDVDASHNMDPQQLESLITPRTSGILGVHLWGRPCNIEALQILSEKHRLRLMFDASHAFGCSHRGRMIGQFGEAEVFSFHATKFINAQEGGAIVTNSDELAEKLRWMKNFGFSDYDKVDYIGTNGKMTEMAAAMGLTSLDSLDEFIDHNRAMYQVYRRHLADLPGVTLIRYDEQERANYQYVIVEIDEGVTGISRNHLVELLHAENILARRYFHPGCHAQEPYRSYYPHAKLLLPATQRLAQRVMALPTGTGVSTDDVTRICDIVRFAVRHGSDIMRRWPKQVQPVDAVTLYPAPPPMREPALSQEHIHE